MNNSQSASLSDKLRVFPQYLIPQHLLSGMTYHLCRCQWKPLKNLMIRSFIRLFHVNMSEADEPDYRKYRHFNHFFTRELKTDARKINADDNVVISPVDGFISQVGNIRDGDIFQAKNHYYSLDELLADNKDMVEQFQDGAFATLYLSPRDYHRIHMPLDGELSRMIYVPGRLFAVNAHTVRVVDRLFARNERVISLFETTAGPMALIMVGAINVGSIETVWAGEITPSAKHRIQSWEYNKQTSDINFTRGSEVGRFNMGSTVILLFGNKQIKWEPGIQVDSDVQMGMPLARINDSGSW